MERPNRRFAGLREEAVALLLFCPEFYALIGSSDCYCSTHLRFLPVFPLRFPIFEVLYGLRLDVPSLHPSHSETALPQPIKPIEHPSSKDLLWKRHHDQVD
jgi:hypothetical protein